MLNSYLGVRPRFAFVTAKVGTAMSIFLLYILAKKGSCELCDRLILIYNSFNKYFHVSTVCISSSIFGNSLKRPNFLVSIEICFVSLCHLCSNNQNGLWEANEIFRASTTLPCIANKDGHSASLFIETKEVTLLTFLDNSKAFDSLDLVMLVDKLHLADITQCVKIGCSRINLVKKNQSWSSRIRIGSYPIYTLHQWSAKDFHSLLY